MDCSRYRRHRPVGRTARSPAGPGRPDLPARPGHRPRAGHRRPRAGRRHRRRPPPPGPPGGASPRAAATTPTAARVAARPRRRRSGPSVPSPPRSCRPTPTRTPPLSPPRRCGRSAPTAGPGVGSPEQAQPLPGQLLPKKAKGARPQFFAEPGMEALVSTMVTLTSEVWVLRERVMTLEQLLADRRVVEGGAVDGFTLSAEDAETRDAEAAAFVARVLRVFYEWREEIVREETPESYREGHPAGLRTGGGGQVKQQQRHGLLPTENHDELAREMFVRALKSHISTEVTPGYGSCTRTASCPGTSRRWASRPGTGRRSAGRWSPSRTTSSGARCGGRARTCSGTWWPTASARNWTTCGPGRNGPAVPSARWSWIPTSSCPGISGASTSTPCPAATGASTSPATSPPGRSTTAASTSTPWARWASSTTTTASRW